jgi:hypothetical protein
MTKPVERYLMMQGRFRHRVRRLPTSGAGEQTLEEIAIFGGSSHNSPGWNNPGSA